VAAARPDRATKFAAEFGVGRVESELGAVVSAPDVDVVDLCSPSYLHADMAIAAARAGKNVIVEKPLTGFLRARRHAADARCSGRRCPRPTP
jgi:predicted dehydrogenase